MKYLLILIVLLLFTSCKEQPIEVTRSDNPEISIQKMLTIEGCNVYRFTDSRDVYVTICPDKRQPQDTSYQYTTNSGKSSSTHRLSSTTAYK